MWPENEKNNIISYFSFLEKYGFQLEFLSFQKNDTINMNTNVALIYKKSHCIAIKIYIDYPFEPICFYHLNDKNELNEIFKFNSSKEIQVYKRDLNLWKNALRKDKFLSYSTVFQVVSESIKKQIKTSKSFYGISIND